MTEPTKTASWCLRSEEGVHHICDREGVPFLTVLDAQFEQAKKLAAALESARVLAEMIRQSGSARGEDAQHQAAKFLKLTSQSEG